MLLARHYTFIVNPILKITMKKVFSKLLLLLAAFFVLGGNVVVAKQAAVSEQEKTQQIVLQGQTMGTLYSIRYYPEVQTPDERSVVTGLNKLFDQLVQEMSTYDSASQVSRFNQSRVIDKPFAVSDQVIYVVSAAQQIFNQSGGGLDITVAPLVNLWGFGPLARHQKLPTQKEIQQTLRSVGMDKLQITEQGLIKKVPELEIDLSGIAKGYGVDAVGRYLESLGVKNYLVEIGGEVRARGHADNRAWRVGIQMPNDDFSVQVQKVLELRNMSLATSGDYHNYYDVDGVRYSHIINPKTGMPLRTPITSITVVLPDCMQADGWTKGLMMLGPEKGIALADELGIAVYMLLKTDKGLDIRQSKAFTRLLDEQQQRALSAR